MIILKLQARSSTKRDSIALLASSYRMSGPPFGLQAISITNRDSTELLTDVHTAS